MPSKRRLHRTKRAQAPEPKIEEPELEEVLDPEDPADLEDPKNPENPDDCVEYNKKYKYFSDFLGQEIEPYIDSHAHLSIIMDSELYDYRVDNDNEKIVYESLDVNKTGNSKWLSKFITSNRIEPLVIIIFRVINHDAGISDL